MMGRFLKETWQMLYWAMFCPSRLQERMNIWPPKKNAALLSATTMFPKTAISTTVSG